MRILKISLNINRWRITSQKRSRIMIVLPRRLKKKVRKTIVFFVKFAKRLITMHKNVGTKTSPNVTSVKSLATFKRIVGTRNGSKQIFVKNRRKKGKKIFSLLLNLTLQQKAMNDMLIVVVIITWLEMKRFSSQLIIASLQP